MPQLVIREATEADLPAVLNLYTAAGIGDEDHFTEEEAKAQFAVFKKYPSFRIFVAELEGIIAGTYELLIMNNMAKRGKKSAIVEDVAVDPTCQGKGIGRAMMQHAMSEAHTAGCYKLALSSNLKREAAHQFYEALDFKKHGYSFLIDLTN